MSQTVLVCGAGMVGVCVALELQRRGMDVTLLERGEPGMETSHGNAGIITLTSLVPLNSPSLWPQLPKLLLNRSASLRYNSMFILRNLGWSFSFLAAARHTAFNKTAKALYDLISLSRSEHRRLIDEAGAQTLFNELGWIYLYRSEADYKKAAFLHKAYASFGLEMENLESADIAKLEPGLKPVFAKGVWVKETWSIRNPSDLVSAYADLFVARGGKIVSFECAELSRKDGAWCVTSALGQSLLADKMVVTLGPWSKDFLSRFGYHVPMGYERGYHMLYSPADGQDDLPVNHPYYDVSAGYVMVPMRDGMRLCSGVELNHIDSKPNYSQIDMAEASAREAIDLGERKLDEPWKGARPTFPDCRPVIGAAPGQDGLFMAFGHQHLGFNTGPGTAQLLADLMEGKSSSIPQTPFSPERYIRPVKK